VRRVVPRGAVGVLRGGEGGEEGGAVIHSVAWGKEASSFSVGRIGRKAIPRIPWWDFRTASSLVIS
jgi:hypothetical protein